MKRLILTPVLLILLLPLIGCGGNTVETPSNLAPLPKNFGSMGTGGGKAKVNTPPGGGASATRD